MTTPEATPTKDDILAIALGPVDIDLALDPAEIVLSLHAVRRYRERVEAVPRWLAIKRLRRLLATAQWRSRPVSWTNVVLHPDVIYGYSPDRSDVCLLVRGRSLVTVLSCRFLRQAAAEAVA